MKTLQGKVAVVTGAASGIGRALAGRLAGEGMSVVLADVDQSALEQAQASLQKQGTPVLAVPTDVSQAQEVARLAQQTMDAFGAVHVLCNNAGVIDMADRPIWETPLAGLRWVLDVNLWGVVHGIHAFVPLMLAQDTDCHIVNTASIAGLLADGHYGLYNTSKHAVVALSETIHLALAERDSKIKVSVLCPGFVATRLVDAERHRPTGLPADPVQVEAQRQERIASMRAVLRDAMSPDQVAAQVISAIRTETFYIMTHAEFMPGIQQRMENILQQRNPT